MDDRGKFVKPKPGAKAGGYPLRGTDDDLIRRGDALDYTLSKNLQRVVEIAKTEAYWDTVNDRLVVPAAPTFTAADLAARVKSQGDELAKAKGVGND